MKKNVIVCIIFLLCSFKVVVCQTDLYKKYEHLPDVMVACIMNFPITDSTTTDITLFLPDNDVTANYLYENIFCFGKLDSITIDSTQNKARTTSAFRLKNDLCNTGEEIKSNQDYSTRYLVCYMYKTKSFVIFDNINSKQNHYDILKSYIFKPNEFINKLMKYKNQ